MSGKALGKSLGGLWGYVKFRWGLKLCTGLQLDFGRVLD